MRTGWREAPGRRGGRLEGPSGFRSVRGAGRFGATGWTGGSHSGQCGVPGRSGRREVRGPGGSGPEGRPEIRQVRDAERFEGGEGGPKLRRVRGAGRFGVSDGRPELRQARGAGRFGGREGGPGCGRRMATGGGPDSGDPAAPGPPRPRIPLPLRSGPAHRQGHPSPRPRLHAGAGPPADFRPDSGSAVSFPSGREASCRPTGRHGRVIQRRHAWMDALRCACYDVFTMR